MQANPCPYLYSSPRPRSFPSLPTPRPKATVFTPQSITVPPKDAISRSIHVAFSSSDEESGGVRETHSRNPELQLLGKPVPVPTSREEQDSDEEKSVDVEEALAPFLKFFKKDGDPGAEGEKGKDLGGGRKVGVEYYEPKSGELVVGVVVSGNERKLDVNVGADMLGTMLTKEVLPLHDEELSYMLCDLERDAEEFMVSGKIGVVKDEDAWSMEKLPGRPVVDVGTVLFAEVLGRTLSGRPLLSTRRMFRKVAWHRVRQIEQLNEPIEVRITAWNTGGLVTRIEGLRAFLPKSELMNRANNFTDLKENVGRNLHVSITQVNEASNVLTISERQAWDWLNLQEGTLLDVTVKKIFTFGALVTIGETNRSGLLHISNISRDKVESVSDFLKVGEKLKALVIKSNSPDKISLSTADLESESGLFLKDKERVLSEAEEMARKYRRSLPQFSTRENKSPPRTTLNFDDEAALYANWKWFRFIQETEQTGADEENSANHL